ncbi:MAG TPA: hypothetical protein VE075_01965, partial [Thermoanaerobaculia bacterium]|nr:hypothetical protein [Thermoanaerobaculia bacterium]
TTSSSETRGSTTNTNSYVRIYGLTSLWPESVPLRAEQRGTGAAMTGLGSAMIERCSLAARRRGERYTLQWNPAFFKPRVRKMPRVTDS